MEEEGVAEMLMDENALASVPRYRLLLSSLFSLLLLAPLLVSHFSLHTKTANPEHSPVLSCLVLSCLIISSHLISSRSVCVQTRHLSQHPSDRQGQRQLRPRHAAGLPVRPARHRLRQTLIIPPYEWHHDCERRAAVQQTNGHGQQTHD